jgi:hypothetical protein
MPKLERPPTTRASINTNINNINTLPNVNTINNNNNKNDGNHQTKQTKLKRKSTDENKAVTKKRKSI